MDVVDGTGELNDDGAVGEVPEVETDDDVLGTGGAEELVPWPSEAEHPAAPSAVRIMAELNSARIAHRPRVVVKAES